MDNILGNRYPHLVKEWHTKNELPLPGNIWNVNTKLDKSYRGCCLNSTGVK